MSGGASAPSGLSRRPQHRSYPHRATPLWVADGAMCIRCDPQGVEVKTLICPQVIAAVAARPVAIKRGSLSGSSTCGRERGIGQGHAPEWHRSPSSHREEKHPGRGARFVATGRGAQPRRPVDQPLQAIPRPRQGVALIDLLVSATPWRGRLP